MKYFHVLILIILLFWEACFFNTSNPTNSLSAKISYLKFNNSICAIDYDKHQILFPLPKKFYQSDDFPAIIHYSIPENNLFYIDSSLVEKSDVYIFENISINDTLTVTIEDEDSRQPYSLIFTGIPIVQIFSSQIMDDVRLPASFILTAPDASDNIQTCQIAMEKRGSSTSRLEKNSFSFEFRKKNNWATKEEQKILSMREDDDWILDAAYWDRSFMRNRISHDLFLDLWEIPYSNDGQSTIKGEYVELFLNNEYFGIYILSERVDRKLLQLSKQNSILFKAVNDQLELRQKYNVQYPNEINRAGIFQAWEELTELQNLIESSGQREFQSEILKYVNINNVVNFHILLMITSALDNAGRNYFLARNENGKYFFVPWDLDATFGRYAFSSKWNPYVWKKNWNDNFLLNPLMKEDFYIALLKSRYAELRQNILLEEFIVSRFDEYYKLLYNSGAYKRNIKRWPVTDEYYDDDDFEKDFEYIKSWISRRIIRLDTIMDNL